MVVMIQRTDNSAADDDYSLVTARRYNYPLIISVDVFRVAGTKPGDPV